ncbi:MAG: PSD1 and planctomycete cytochrome C domain-containing protein [Fimbriiglobus sp.]|nr:PSD1 and planctomycete cytochrome C domain-containing protein [Fimbriiglobus sp.]
MFRRSLLALLVLTPFASSADPKPTFTAEQVKFYTDSVSPILKANCLKCHGDNPKKLKGEFDLRTRAAVLKGGESGTGAVPRKPKESLLVQAVAHTKKGYEMPPGNKLKPDEISTITKWVELGLPVPPDALGEATAEHPKKKEPTPEQKAYWAYQPVKRPTPPGGGHPVDAFLDAKLATKNLTPGSIADKATLVRRAYYDLTGLPPTPEQIDAYVNDADPKAWEKLIDTLLASPQYGEKWGRYWLDVVRFAETNGYERDGPKANAWRYRDYVIRSFNTDKPYNRFVQEQIAGDELPKAHPDDSDPVVATGYYRLGVWDDEPADPLQSKFDGYDDIVSITGQAFLGMTLNCARCHDHKGDPLFAEDYYKMVAFFRDIREHSNDRNLKTSSNQTDITPFEQRKLYEKDLAERQERTVELTKQIVAIEDEAIKKMPAEDQRASEGVDRPLVVKKVPMFLDEAKKKQYSGLKRQVEDLKRKPSPHQELALSVNNCDPTPPATFVNVRGNPHANGAEVKPGFPEVLGFTEPTIPPATKGAKSSGRRTVLANWLTDPKNPLTARVMMNRIWQWHFGKGLVPTANDFGKLGEQPTHPELLDWLAAEFVDGGWTLKRMHKLMMTSSAYRRSSAAIASNMKADPANTYLWRFNMRRLTAEEVRDSILAASGELNLSKLGGPSMYPKLSAEVLAGISHTDKKAHWPDSPKDEQNRRSVYAFVKRSIQVPLLVNHDQADPDNSCPVRYTTTVPTQALGMLNGEFTNEQAELLAKRLAKDAGPDVAKQVARGIRLTTGRVPDSAEVAKDVAFIDALRTKHTLSEAKAMQQYTLLLLNANEFVYVD